MSTVEADTVVNVPIRTAYNQWTQFEDFPEFLPGQRIKTRDEVATGQYHLIVAIGANDCG